MIESGTDVSEAGASVPGVSAPRVAGRHGEAAMAFEREFVVLLNRARANPARYGALAGVDLSAFRPLPPLAEDRRLVVAARKHSADMARLRYMGHNAADGRDPGAQMSDAGFPWDGWGQSIAAGHPDAAAALRHLVRDDDSPGRTHRAHLLGGDEDFALHTHVGVGVCHGAGPYDTYLTVNTASTQEVPAGAAQSGCEDGYVRAVYRAVLGRDPGDGENFRARRDVVQATLYGPESNIRRVRSYFAEYLGRLPSGREMAFYCPALQDGVPEEEVRARVLASADFASLSWSAGAADGQDVSDPSDERWVRAAYIAVLARPPSDRESELLVHRVRLDGRAAAALELLRSQECRASFVREAYHLTGREPDEVTVKVWAASSLDACAIRARVLASPEFYRGAVAAGRDSANMSVMS